MTELITCEGHGCPIKEHCQRFTSLPSDVQSWSEFRYDSETGCEYFMEAKQNG